jgi:hypothetical protein
MESKTSRQMSSSVFLVTSQLAKTAREMPQHVPLAIQRPISMAKSASKIARRPSSFQATKAQRRINVFLVVNTVKTASIALIAILRNVIGDQVNLRLTISMGNVEQTALQTRCITRLTKAVTLA